MPGAAAWLYGALRASRSLLAAAGGGATATECCGAWSSNRAGDPVRGVVDPRMPDVRVEAASLPPFSNQRAVCAECGSRREIRVHFDRNCADASGDHFHRVCRCGHQWVERCSEG